MELDRGELTGAPDPLSDADLCEPPLEQLKLGAFAESPNTRAPISPSLARAIQADPSWQQKQELTIAEPLFDALEGKVMAELAELKHPYHNKEHTENVLRRATELAKAAGLSVEDTQLLRVAALFHDYDHAGNTFRQTVGSAERSDLSNEEFAALKADEMVGDYLSPAQRLTLQGLILATSFAQSNPDILPDPSYQRDYKPVTNMEKLLAFADINNLADPLDDWMNENFDVLSESGRGGIPENFDGYIENRLGFMTYIQMKLDDVKPLVSSEYGADLQSLHAARVEQVVEMKDQGDTREKFETQFNRVRQRRLAELDTTLQ